MKNEEQSIKDQLKNLEIKFPNLQSLIFSLKYRILEKEKYSEEEINAILRDSEELVDKIAQLASETSEIESKLAITQKELETIREKSNPINVIYTKVPLSIRVFALLILPLSIIQIWKLLLFLSSRKNKNRYKEEENLPYEERE